MTEAASGFRERTFSAQDGLQLYYRDYGDPLSQGTPVVCLSGLTRNSKDFHGLASRLSTRRRVVCPDYRGRGRSRSDPDWRNYRPQVILGDVVQLLAANNLHGVVICGASFGGLLAMGLAVAAPTVLAGVILNDVGPKVGPAAGQRILEYISIDRAQPDWAAAVTEIKTRFPNLSYTTEAGWRGFAEATYRQGADGRLHFDWDVALARPFMEARDEPRDFWPLYRALAHLPVLAIRGGLSEVLSETTFARMAAEKPDLIQLTLPSVGHLPTLEEPESERAIDEFLTRIDG
jgi:pimeloyl-ACP methyl ester carboxylesterase